VLGRLAAQAGEDDVGRDPPLNASTRGIGFEALLATVELAADADAQRSWRLCHGRLPRCRPRATTPTVDAIRLVPTTPERGGPAQKFLAEHLPHSAKTRCLFRGRPVGPGSACNQAGGGRCSLGALASATTLIRVPGPQPPTGSTGQFPPASPPALLHNPRRLGANFTGRTRSAETAFPAAAR